MNCAFSYEIFYFLENQDDNCSLECPVCLQPYVHAVRLPCSHVFCYLCVKGVANRSKRCAMCRQEIPVDFLSNPELLSNQEIEKETEVSDGYNWYYEGWNGWWQYDPRATTELEERFNSGQFQLFEICIAGFLYVIDFENMIQYRRNDPSRRRRIKRDLSTISKKGVAGLKVKTTTIIPSDNERVCADGVEDNAEDMATGVSTIRTVVGETERKKQLRKRQTRSTTSDVDDLTTNLSRVSLRTRRQPAAHCPEGIDNGAHTVPDGTDTNDMAVRRAPLPVDHYSHSQRADSGWSREATVDQDVSSESEWE